MKISKDRLMEIIREVIAETDGFPKILNKNKEIEHN